MLTTSVPIRVEIPLNQGKMLKVPFKPFLDLPKVEITPPSGKRHKWQQLKDKRHKAQSTTAKPEHPHSGRPSEKPKDNRPPCKRGKSVDSTEPGNKAPLSFRGPLHSARRDEKINIEENDLIFHDDISSIKCTAAIIEQIADNLIKMEIEEQTKAKKLLLAVQWALEESPRAVELVGIVQNALIPSSPIYKRLRIIQRLHRNELLDELTTFTPVKECHKGLVSKGINLHNFLSCVDKINKTKKLKKIIFPAFGDSKETQKEVLEVLRKWNDSKAINELKAKMNLLTAESMARQNISCIEHSLIEKMPSIEKTSLNEMRKSYFCNGHIVGKITINGVNLEIKEPCEEEAFWKEFLTKLYTAFGHELPTRRNKDQLSIDGQISALCNIADVGYYSAEMQQCFQLLKMGSTASWNLADMCIRLGLNDLITETELPLEAGQPIEYHFHINKEHAYVEQIKTYRLGSFCEFPISWKASLPTEESWHCRLRFLQIGIYEEAGDETIRNIEKHMVAFLQNPEAAEILSSMNIQTTRTTKKSLLAHAEGIKIISKTKNNTISIPRAKTTPTIIAKPKIITNSAPTIITNNKK